MIFKANKFPQGSSFDGPVFLWRFQKQEFSKKVKSNHDLNYKYKSDQKTF